MFVATVTTLLLAVAHCEFVSGGPVDDKVIETRQQNAGPTIDFIPLADVLLFRANDVTLTRDVTEKRHVVFPLQEGQSDLSAFYSGALVLRLGQPADASYSLRVELSATDSRCVAAWDVQLSAGVATKPGWQKFVDLQLPLSCCGNPKCLQSLSQLTIRSRPHDASEAGQQSGGKIGERLHSLRIVMPRNPGANSFPTPDGLASAAFEWFEKYRNPETGLVPDRAPNRTFLGNGPKRELCCSIASVGYYLSLLPDAVDRGRLDEQAAQRRALQVLSFLETNAEHHGGLLYHFIDLKTGQRFFDCEFSSLDTAILLNGCMVASVRFKGDVAAVADRLIDRVDWSQFRLAANGSQPESLSMGWKRDVGLLSPMDIRSSEFAMPYMLAIGARTNAVDPQLWKSARVETGIIAGTEVMNPSHGLFTSYYGLGWHSQAFCREANAIDLWTNAEASARANRAFCQLEKSQTYSSASGNWWGISAGDSPDGYYAPGLTVGSGRGTVWPTASLAAIPWSEAPLKQDLISWQRSATWTYVCGPFGLAPFNLDNGWVAEDLIGIDIGSMAVNIVNHRNGSIWKLWEQHPVAQRAIGRLKGAKIGKSSEERSNLRSPLRAAGAVHASHWLRDRNSRNSYLSLTGFSDNEN